MTAGLSNNLFGAIFFTSIAMFLLTLPIYGAAVAAGPTIRPYVEIVFDCVQGLLTGLALATVFGIAYKKLMPDVAAPMTQAPGAKIPSQFDAFDARLINAVIWIYLWLSHALLPVVVAEGGSYWTEKALQLVRFGPFDDLPRLLGRGFVLAVLWFIAHLLLGRLNAKPRQQETR